MMMGWGGALIAILLIILIVGGVVVLLALGIWALIRRSKATPGEHRTFTRRPLEILQERYASGEITREQYEQMRRDLET
jgi:putative membrane protein